jgi:hypothetical protein
MDNILLDAALASNTLLKHRIEILEGAMTRLRAERMVDKSCEHCSICDSLTGRAGAADDSIFWLGGVIGPLCEECDEQLRSEVLDDIGVDPAEVERLTAEVVAWRADSLRQTRRYDRLAVAEAENIEQIERLRAIVDKLPKTADGVPVVPGETYYARFHEEDEDETWHIEECHYIGHADPHYDWEVEHWLWDEAYDAPGFNVYSTREAAEAAGGE